ncbi:hypothetical protein ACB098_04G120000 [Castanea mollissima]
MKSSNSPLYLLSCLLMLLLLPDTCVANLNASISINGFPCITASKVSASDFFFDLSKEGLNSPHFHPHATEMGLVIKGRVLVGFVTTSNVYYFKVLTRGEIFVISRRLVHFQKNVGKGKATVFTSFNSHMPGVVVLSTTLFGSQPLWLAFQVDDGVVNRIKSKFGS